jgi:peptide/nickel transport system substrate-binding protein
MVKRAAPARASAGGSLLRSASEEHRADEPPRPGGILREGYDYDFSRCDPTGAHVDPAWCAVYETVTVSGPEGELGPMLADSWREDPANERRWRFRIRSAVGFQSGDPCDANAVAEALRLHGDPVEAPINAFFWRNVAGVEADGDEVVVELHEPSSGMPRLLRSWHSAIHNQARRRMAGDGFGRTTCDGTGPFTFVESVSGSHLDVSRWNGYRGPRTTWQENAGPAHLDGIRWIPILDDRDRAAALEDGEVDCIQNASLLDVDRLAANPELELIEFQQSALVYVGLDHEASDQRFGDLRVRQAVSSAIDRQRLVEQDLLGHGWPAFGPIPSHSRWYAPEVEAGGGFDPRRAAALLDAAGLEAGADGVRFEVEAVVVNDATVRRVAGTVREMLADVGIRLQLDVIPGFVEFYGRLNDHPPAFISKWFWPEPIDAIIGFVATWGQNGGPNFQRASDEALDRACRRWEVARDDEHLRAAARDIQVRSAESLPIVPLLSPAAVWAHHRRVRNWRPNRHDLYPLYGDVWLAEA